MSESKSLSQQKRIAAQKGDEFDQKAKEIDLECSGADAHGPGCNESAQDDNCEFCRRIRQSIAQALRDVERETAGRCIAATFRTLIHDRTLAERTSEAIRKEFNL